MASKMHAAHLEEPNLAQKFYFNICYLRKEFKPDQLGDWKCSSRTGLRPPRWTCPRVQRWSGIKH